jgi:hypothetical protein
MSGERSFVPQNSLHDGGEAAMEIRAIACILCGSAFGLLLILAGYRRLRQVALAPGPGTRESIFWGLTGIALGLALIAGIVWFLFSPEPK